MKRKHLRTSFHLSWAPPLPHWPDGCWALYQISGDEIGVRYEHDKGKITAMHSWCGYLGTFATLAEVVAKIEEAKAKELADA